MTEPSDEDITRALARLAGIDLEDTLWLAERFAFMASELDFEVFAPFADWRDLGPMLQWLWEAGYSCVFGQEGYEWQHRGKFVSVDLCPMRAACLALYQMEQDQ